MALKYFATTKNSVLPVKFMSFGLRESFIFEAIINLIPPKIQDYRSLYCFGRDITASFQKLFFI